MTDKTREDRKFQIRLLEIQMRSEWYTTYSIAWMIAGFSMLIALTFHVLFSKSLNGALIPLINKYTVLSILALVMGFFLNFIYNRRTAKKIERLREDFGLLEDEEDEASE